MPPLKLPYRDRFQGNPKEWSVLGWMWYELDKCNHYIFRNPTTGLLHSLCGRLVISPRLDEEVEGAGCTMCAKMLPVFNLTIQGEVDTPAQDQPEQAPLFDTTPFVKKGDRDDYPD